MPRYQQSSGRWLAPDLVGVGGRVDLTAGAVAAMANLNRRISQGNPEDAPTLRVAARVFPINRTMVPRQF
jgi:hypothetical protein